MMDPNEIRARLEAALVDAHVQVNDLTGTRDHFELVVVSPSFHGLARVQRHRLIYNALSDEMTGPIHALTMQLLTPEQWAAQQGQGR